MKTSVAIIVALILGAAAGGNYFLSGGSTECAGSYEEKLRCFSRHYAALVEIEGTAAAIKDLEARFPDDPFVRSSCHFLMHEIAHASVAQFETPEAAYAAGSTFCWDGYYHGIVEEVAKARGDNGAREWLAGICSTIRGTTVLDFKTCTHSVGHGIAASTQGDLPASLALCDEFPTSELRLSCYQGVFMYDAVAHAGAAVSGKASPLYPCDAVSIDYARGCYTYYMKAFLQAHGGDTAKVFALCGTITDDVVRHSCNESVGRMTTVHDITRAEEIGMDACGTALSDAQKADCYDGVSYELIIFHESDRQALAWCSSVEPSLAPRCTAHAALFYATLFAPMTGMPAGT